MNEQQFRNAIASYLAERRKDITFIELMPEDKFTNYHVVRLMRENGGSWNDKKAQVRIDELQRGLVSGMLWCNTCSMAVPEHSQEDMRCLECGNDLMSSVPPHTSPIPQ